MNGENKILVVEDNYTATIFLSYYLNRWGYDPIFIRTREELKKYQKETFLVVMLDINLPKILDLLEEVQSNITGLVMLFSVNPENQTMVLEEAKNVATLFNKNRVAIDDIHDIIKKNEIFVIL